MEPKEKPSLREVRGDEHVLSDETLHGLVARLEQLKAISSEPDSVQSSINEVKLKLRYVHVQATSRCEQRVSWNAPDRLPCETGCARSRGARHTPSRRR